MKRFNFKGLLIVGVILGFAMMVGEEYGFSVPVENPMTSDLDGGNYKIFNLSDVITKGPYVDVRSYASFSAAIDAIGASNKTLLIPDSQAVSANKTVPSNVTLAFLKGGSLNIAGGVTVTINGTIEAGVYQIFTGTGSAATGDLCKEVWANWWGLDTGASATVNDTALSSAVADNRTINIAPGTYNITHLGLGDNGVSSIWSCEIVGKGYVVLQKSTPGTDVITMGEPKTPPQMPVTRASWVSLRNLTIGATAAVSYGIRMMFATDCSFYNVRIESTNITTGLYIDYSWENVFYNTTISCNNAVESYFNSHNNNSFWGGKWTGSSSTTDIGIILYGRSNIIEGVDFSNFNIGVYMSGSGGCAVNSCYFENNTTDIKFQNSGNVKGLSIQGNNFKALGPTANSIVYDESMLGSNVVITGNNFEGYNTAITITGFCSGWVIMGNNFDNCTTQVSGIGEYTFSSISNGTTNGEVRWHGDEREAFILNDTSLTLLNGIKVGSTGDIATTKKHLTATATWDPPQISNGTSTQILLTVNGAVAGDVARASHTQTGTAKINISARVTAANQVAVVIHNISGGALNIPSGTVRAAVWQH